MKKLRITIENKTYDVTVEDLSEAEATYPGPMPRPMGPVGSGAAITPPLQSVARPTSIPVGEGAVTSPMAGAIKAVLVKPGDSVQQGQSLVILEAMKMENQITAPAAGKVKSVDVAVGDAVHEQQTLVVLE